MSEQDREELGLDGEQNDSELTDFDSSNDEAQDNDTNPEQKNKSNWKKMAETKKALERELKETRDELKQVKDWANSLYGEDQQRPFYKKEETISEDKVAKLEERLFLSENKEAKEYLEEIKQTQAKYNMDLDDAWIFVKSKLPPESVTKKEFDLKSKPKEIKKDLKDVTPEDALKLPKEEQSKWRKMHGWE